MPPRPYDRPGLPELQEVLQRVGSTTLKDSLGKGLVPQHYGQIAHWLYDRSQPAGHHMIDAPLDANHPAMDPEAWKNLALWHDPESAMAAVPEMNFDQYAGMTPDERDIFNENLGHLEASMQGYAGPGWSRADEDRAGRSRQPFELSPGDYLTHQRRRDLHLMKSMLDRNQGFHDELGNLTTPPLVQFNQAPGYDWDPTGLIPKPEEGTSLFNAKGGGILQGNDTTDPERYAREESRRRAEQALHWYRKSDGATHTVGKPGEAGNTTANYPEYGGYQGTFRSMDNPDYAFGAFANSFSGPLEWANNRIAMRNAGQRDADQPTSLRRAGFLGYLGANVSDYFRNALMEGFPNHPMSDALQVARLAAINAHSPTLPTEKHNPDPWERSKLIKHARGVLERTNNLSATDHYWGKTGRDMSFGGQLGATLASSTQDPTLLLSGLRAGNLTKRLAHVGAEAVEDLPLATAATGLQVFAPREQGLHVPKVSQWLTEDHRPDKKWEPAYERDTKIKSHDTNQDKALEEARRLNSKTPRRRSGGSNYMNNLPGVSPDPTLF